MSPNQTRKSTGEEDTRVSSGWARLGGVIII